MGKKKSEYMKFVEHELDILLNDLDLPTNGLGRETIKYYQSLRKDILDLCEAFEKNAGHIGSMRAKATLKLFAKLASRLPLTPLTGEDNEWQLIFFDKDVEPKDDDVMYVNKRCSRIFKRRNGTAFDTEAIVFSHDGSTWYKTADSKKDISFPYDVPVHPERVRVEKPLQPEEMN